MRTLVTGLLVCCLIVSLAACARAPGLEPTATTVLRLTAERTAAAPVATAVVYPTLTPQLYCGGVTESLLVVGERGRVTLTEDGRWLNLRAGAGTDKDVIAQLAPLDDFMVLDGVRCAGPYAWFQIDFRGTVGWIAEGFEGQYYAEPWLTG